jgi:hypothetical protein
VFSVEKRLPAVKKQALQHPHHPIATRAAPPPDLTLEQADEWRAVTNRLPAGWFPPAAHPMLSAYCGHVIAARHIAQLIVQAEQARRLHVGNYDRLLRMQETESRALSSLATRLAFTQQASVRAELAHRPDWVDNPWEFRG